MTTPFDNAVLRGFRAMARVAGVTVQYTPLGGQPYSLAAVRARTEWASDGGPAGLAVASNRRDYLVVAADMTAVPEPGDTITDAGQTWVVMDDGTGRGHGPMDPSHQLWRIHTKRTA